MFGSFALGMFVTIPPWIVSLLLVSDPSASAWARGADSEEWTSAALRRCLPREYRIVNDVQLGNANADHVVVGPGGVFVVETKWCSKRWATLDGAGKMRAAASQARHVARTIARILADHDLDVECTPVVVLWGGDVARWKRGTGVRSVDRVDIVAGTHLSEWADRLPSDTSLLPVAAIIAALRKHI